MTRVDDLDTCKLSKLFGLCAWFWKEVQIIGVSRNADQSTSFLGNNLSLVLMSGFLALLVVCIGSSPKSAQKRNWSWVFFTNRDSCIICLLYINTMPIL
jgi:hypothetical protein